MRTGRVGQKRGFTLVETIVTVGIVATLAAVVVPEVVKQFDSSEPTRIQQDLKNLATAIQTFNVNVKAMPGDIDDLANPIEDGTALATATDTMITGAGGLTFFSTVQESYWNGPYIDAPLVESVTEAVRESGNGSSIHDDFVCFNATTNTAGISGDQDCAAPATTDRLFIAIRVTGLGANTDSRFIAINDLFDGTAETTASLRSDNGRIRHLTVSTVPTVFFLVSPLN